MTTETPTTPTRPTPIRTTPTLPESAALTRSLEPISAERFLTEHWEQQPLVVHREEAGRFDDLLSEADVERLVLSTGIRYPAFRLVKEGGQLELEEYTTDVPWRPPFTATADVRRVLAEWEAGATIVLQGLHLHWRPLAVFCRDLERGLGEPVQANAYYTPRRSQGFAVHHDTHDVLVLQVAGEKRWLLSEPAVELPLKHQRYRKELGGGEAAEEVTLRAGDTLYLPRGWLHEALTSESDSLHLTLGINVYTWADALKAALADCEDDLAFRRGVPADGEGGEELLERLGTRLEPEQVARRRRRRFVASRGPLLEGQLSQLRALGRLDEEALLERRPTVIADVHAGGDGVELVFEGKALSFPARVRAEVEFCATVVGVFRPADLPGDLDGAGRLVLVRRLVREGFLRLTEPAGPGAPSPSSDGRAGA